MLYVLADEKNSPLLVKYDSSASYLPVFETELSAREAMVNLKKGASSSVCNPTANYQCKPFEWCLFKQWQETLTDPAICYSSTQCRLVTTEVAREPSFAIALATASQHLHCMVLTHV